MPPHAASMAVDQASARRRAPKPKALRSGVGHRAEAAAKGGCSGFSCRARKPFRAGKKNRRQPLRGKVESRPDPPKERLDGAFEQPVKTQDQDGKRRLQCNGKHPSRAGLPIPSKGTPGTNRRAGGVMQPGQLECLPDQVGAFGDRDFRLRTQIVARRAICPNQSLVSVGSSSKPCRTSAARVGFQRQAEFAQTMQVTCWRRQAST